VWLFVPAVVVPAAAIVITANGGAPIFFGMFAVTRVASLTGRRAPIIAAFVAAATLPILFDLNNPAGPRPRVAYFLIGLTGSMLLGALLHHQRRLVAELARTQFLLRDAAAAEERRRIAREIHDILAHSLTVVVLNLGAARKASRTHPELVDDALGRAEQVGRESLDAVRSIVGLLRPDDGEPTGAATPMAGDVPTVVDAHVAAGADVGLHVSGDLSAIGPVSGYALSRIVQEALTNASRHAPGARVDVRVDVETDQVALEVHNAPARRPPLDRDSVRQGLGIVGMRERVAALGGTFHAGRRADGGWQVTCAVPAPSRRMTEPA
jgi:signal transduction histidine kinase